MDYSFCIFVRQNFLDITNAMMRFKKKYVFYGCHSKMLIRDKIRFIRVEMRAEVKQLRVMMHLYQR